MFKRYLLSLALRWRRRPGRRGSLDEPMMFMKGILPGPVHGKRAEQRFARQDTDKDGTPVGGRERRTRHGQDARLMQQSGKAMPGKMGNMGNMRPMQDTTKGTVHGAS